VVRKWARVPPEVPISTDRVLFDLWTRFGSSLPYCDSAVADLIERIVGEFPERKIRMKAVDFCPPETAPIRTVGELCRAVTQSEEA
jgi:hypothetical protein